MESSSSQVSPTAAASVNLPANAIIHGNVQLEPAEGPSSQGSYRDGPIGKLSEEERVEQQRASDMQLWWDESMSRNMDIPDGYSDVAVLIVKWAENLDQLKCGPEVEELRDVFEKSFRYSTEILELNLAKKPQHQLNSAMAKFIADHDGPNKLMIIYYTGHGLYNYKTDSLNLTATDDQQVMNRYWIKPSANFSVVESQLQTPEIDADVLTILDTCFASNIQKSGEEDDRTYELLSACGLDQTTSSPGPNSFTRALIDSLTALLADAAATHDGSFTTFNLQQRINLHPARRDTPSMLWNRLRHHDRHIRLAPLRADRKLKIRSALYHPINGYLNLRLALKDPYLDRDQIEALTRDLALVFNAKGKLAVRRIDWMGIKKPARADGFKRGALAVHFFFKWRNRVLQKRNRTNKRKVGRDEAEPDSDALSASRKKRSCTQQRMSISQASDDAMEGLETTEKGLDAVETGPLTPVSSG